MTPLFMTSKVICLCTLPVSITLTTLKTPTPLESQTLRVSVFSSALMFSSSVCGTAGTDEWKSVMSSVSQSRRPVSCEDAQSDDLLPRLVPPLFWSAALKTPQVQRHSMGSHSAFHCCPHHYLELLCCCVGAGVDLQYLLISKQQ